MKQKRSVSRSIAQKQENPSSHSSWVDNRPEAILQRQVQQALQTNGKNGKIGQKQFLSGDPFAVQMLQKAAIQRVALTEGEIEEFEDHMELLERMEESLSLSRTLPPLLGVEFYQDVEIAQGIIGGYLESGENPGGKAMSVVEWRMETLEERWRKARVQSALDGNAFAAEMSQSELKTQFVKEFNKWLGIKDSVKPYNTGVTGPTSSGKTVRNLTTSKSAFDGMVNDVKGGILKENDCRVFNISLSYGEKFEATDLIIVEDGNFDGAKSKPKMTFHVWGKYM